MDFAIHRRDRFQLNDQRGGGVLLAVRNTIPSLRRPDMETSAEIIVCELQPSCKKKILMAVFYRPPSSDCSYLSEFTKFIRKASRTKFDQLLIVGDFNLPNIDWPTMISSSDSDLYNIFTKSIKDHFLWQVVDFPTRQENLLDLVLTNIPDKIVDIERFYDILDSDHKLIKFYIDLRIARTPQVKRQVCNFKKADWSDLKRTLSLIDWDLCFVENDINALLDNRSDVFLTAVDQHIPKNKARNVNEHPWIDHELLQLIKVKNKRRAAAIKSGSADDQNKFKQIRREVKALIKIKKKHYSIKLKESLLNNSKRFWSFVKSMTKQNRAPSFLKDGQRFVSNNKDKADLFNCFFQSVFIANNGTIEFPQETTALLADI